MTPVRTEAEVAYVANNPRYRGDVWIPHDQPILARCGVCHEWVIYAMRIKHNRGQVWFDGEVLQLAARRGGTLAGDRRGVVVLNRDAEGWGTDRHRCPRGAVVALRR